MSVIEKFAHEMLLSWNMSWEGQRIYGEAHGEAYTDTKQDEQAPWQYRMDLAEKMQEDGEKWTVDVEARAIAAGVDVTDMLYLVDQRLNGPALAA